MSERVHEDEKRVKIQKRPLFVNIDELYANHKEYASNILRMEPCGRSNFFMFRPENVVEVGSKRTNVCVCDNHQNIKLMVDALCNGKIEKYLFMNEIVYDKNSPECIL